MYFHSQELQKIVNFNILKVAKILATFILFYSTLFKLSIMSIFFNTKCIIKLTIIENTNVNLPSMRTSDFSTSGTSVGTKDFSINATCLNDAVNTSYSATISDNFAPTTTNPNGILVNSIPSGSGGSNIKIRLTDTSNAPSPISPLNLNNKFTFGSLNSSKCVSKALKASYYAETVPVTPGIVKSIATVNLIYD